MARLHAPILFATAVLIAGAFSLFPACGDQCNRAEDCATGEVCYAGICEPLTQDYVRCGSNTDCDPNGAFVCRAGRCTLAGVPGPVPMADSGMVEDAMTPADGGDASTTPADGGDAMVGMDVDDAGTSTIADAGTSTIADAGTSTVADGG